MHVEPETLERLLGGELPERDERVAREHIASCAACAEALETARLEDGEIADLLGLLDDPVPEVDPDRLVHRARRRLLRPRLVAAGLVLFVAAGAASAMPGSPLRSWLARALVGSDDAVPVAPAAEQSADRGAPAGVSVPPADDFELVFQSSQESGVVLIALGDQPEVTVYTEHAGVGYSVESDRVRILNTGLGGDYRVLIPRDAESIRIRIGHTVVFRKRGAAISSLAARDAAGRYVVDFRGLGR